MAQRLQQVPQEQQLLLEDNAGVGFERRRIINVNKLQKGDHLCITDLHSTRCKNGTHKFKRCCYQHHAIVKEIVS